MKEQRHPHPHVDPRQPRNGAAPETNPPVFVWKPPVAPGGRYDLSVARDPAFADVCLSRQDLSEPMFLPERAFEPGRYFWKWTTGGIESDTFEFEVRPDAVLLEVPSAAVWLSRFPSGHPRVYIRADEVAAVRESRHGARAGQWAALKAEADKLLAQPHEIAEPPFLPPWEKGYEARFWLWRNIMWDSRRFVAGAQTLALAYLAGGDPAYARAACRRMASISLWDPDGSSHIDHNDEAHMSVIWNGPQACDWVWDQFTDAERERVIRQFRRRGEINYEHMHGRGTYGVERFDSHAGREIVFLAQIALVFHEHIPAAKDWLEWLRPVLCGIWPVWAGGDGAWAEGPAYANAYVGIMAMFATALKRGTGIDLYRRPFWRGHAHWREWCVPPYAEWVGFGDCWGAGGVVVGGADLAELIERQTGGADFARYVALCRNHPGAPTSPSGDSLQPIQYLADAAEQGTAAPRERGMLRVFPGAGCAAIRTSLDDPSRDIAFLFRSSPLGAISHSHADNNDFILHVAGRTMAMPSGFYDGYASDHHAHWVWQTKSHNCVTLSDAGQLIRSHDSLGGVENAFEDDRLAYVRGNADASYDRADRCRRHVVFLKPHNCFLLIDEFIGVRGVHSSLQWNLHAMDPIRVDEAKRSFLVERGASSLEGHFLYHDNSFFSLSEGWDPPPIRSRDSSPWPNQYHLRFTPSAIWGSRNLGVLLCPGHAGLVRAIAAAERIGGVEQARISNDLILINQGRGIDCGGVRIDAVAVLTVGGLRYEIGESGVRPS